MVVNGERGDTTGRTLLATPRSLRDRKAMATQARS
jgi:hypothetical protein